MHSSSSLSSPPQIPHFHSDIDHHQTIQNNVNKIIVFIFFAEWNQQSKKFLYNLNNSMSMFGKFQNVGYFGISAQKCPSTFKRYRVQKVPTVLVLGPDRNVAAKFDGNQIGPIFDQLEKFSTQFKAQFEKNMAIWYPKIENLIQSSPITVFLKGTPQNPVCNSSKQLVLLLKNHKIAYSNHNICQNKNLQNWLKQYSKCEQFPLIFMNGKIVGSVGKFKQMIEKDELNMSTNTNTNVNVNVNANANTNMNGNGNTSIFQECRVLSQQEKYNKFVNENQTVIFIEGFTFENKESEKKVEQIKKKYGENIALYNIAMDKNMKQFLIEKMAKKIPLTVHNKIIIQ